MLFIEFVDYVSFRCYIICNSWKGGEIVNIKNRIYSIREALSLSQEAFGKRIGVTRSAVSNYESGGRNVTEQVIKAIIREFNVNEEWLRTGEGEMFNESDTFSLDEYAKQKALTNIEFDIMKSYMELDPDVRKIILSTFKKTLSSDRVNKKKVEEKIDTVIELIESEPKHAKNESSKDSKTDAPSTEPSEPSLEELEEEYKKIHSKSVSKTDAPASNGTEEDSNKVI